MPCLGLSPPIKAPYFNEFCVRTPVPAAQLVKRLEKRGILAGLPLSRFYPELTHLVLDVRDGTDNVR